MESQNEENPVGSSSSTFPIESESQLPMQVDEVVDETGKRKLISDAWNHFTPVMINGVRFGVYLGFAEQREEKETRINDDTDDIAEMGLCSNNNRNHSRRHTWILCYASC